MNRFSFFLQFFLLVNIINISNAKELSSYKTEFYNVEITTSINEQAPSAISATIAGTTSVCLNSTKPNITFTGTGGTAPYTFTYNVNGGGDLTVSTTGGNNNAIVPVNINTSGVFIFTLTNVSDASSLTQTLSEQATVTVNALPAVNFTVTDNQCSGAGILFTPSLTGNYSYLWDFGDGSTSTAVNPTHLFTTSGVGTQSYFVKLTITDNTTTCQNTFTKNITTSQLPDASLDGSGSGVVFNGVPAFRICSNDISTFSFSNTSTTTSTNQNYKIDWGDGTPDFVATTWTTTTHTYGIGLWKMTYTVTGPTGCINAKTYYVFDGSNPAVSFGNPGNTSICISQTITFPITGTENNPNGTTYTISYNDGTPDMVYTHPAPLEVTHKFLKSSCGTTSSDGTNFYQNAFFARVIATNICGTSASSVMPIYVSTPPTADFSMISNNVCTNTQTCFVNTSINGNAINGGLCISNSNLIWTITPASGFTISSGNLGNDFGKADPSLWNSGSNSICPVFTQPGTYTITMKIGNRCDIDQKVKTICVEAPLIPQFTLSATQGCAPFNVKATNKTDTSNTCLPNYKWTVDYIPNYCGTTSGYTFTSGTSTSSANPSFQFTNPGIYSIRLITTNSCGALSTPVQNVTVTKPPTVFINSISDFCGTATVIPVAIVAGCAPSTSTLSYAWSFPGGSPASSTILNPGTITYNNSGNYTISLVVTNDCGASDSAKATFKVKPVPIITNTVLAQTICSGLKTDSIILTSNLSNVAYYWTATASSGIAGFVSSGNSKTIPAATIINSTGTPGTVTYSITPSLNGCFGDVVYYIITVNPAPVITAQPQSVQVCQGGTSTPLSVVVSNGLGTPSYKWYRNTVNNNKTGTEIPGEISSTYTPPIGSVETLYYYCVITFTSGGCSDLISNTASVSVEPPPVITTQPTPSQAICSGGTISVPLSAAYTGGAGIATYQWYSNSINTTTGGTIIPGATKIDYTPPTFPTVGNYYFYAEIKFAGSACGLIVTDTAKIIVVSDPVVNLQPIATQTLCQYASPVDLVVSAMGGTGVFLYQWFTNSVNNNSSGIPIPYATNNGFAPTTSFVGTFYYYCVISQPNGTGCTVTTNTSEMIVKAAPTFTTQPVSSTVCLGVAPAILTVTPINGTGIPQYQWYSNTKDSISGGSVISGATDSTFIPPSGNVGTMFYYCIVTYSSGGCSNITSEIAQVTINAYPVISTYRTVISSGETFIVSPNQLNGDIVPSGTTYTWSTPVISPANSITGASSQLTPQTTISQTLISTIQGLATVTYTVTPTSGLCQGAVFNVIVTVNPQINPNVILKNITCFGVHDGSLQTSIQGGVPFKTGNPYQVTWTGPDGFTSTATSISNLYPGNYFLTIKDSVGITYSTTYSITEPADIIITTVIKKNVSCFGTSNGEVAITVTGGTPPYRYTWEKNAVPFTGSTDILNLSPGSYIVAVNDANNCSPKKDTFLITEPSAIAVTLINKTNLICYADSNGTISVNVAGGVPFEKTPGVFDYNYAWTGPNGFSGFTKNLSGLVAGSYSLTVTDSTGCSQNFTTTITQPVQVIINAVVKPVTCYGTNDASITINITGGVPPYQIQWSNLGKGTFQNNLSPGIYTVTVTDNNGCQKSKDIPVVEAAFFIQPTVTQISCFGANDGSINLNVQGGIPPVTLVWSDNSTAGSTRNRLGPGTYTASLSDASSCSFIKTFIIIEPLKLNLTADITNAFDCNNPNSGAINLTITGGTEPYNIVWSNGETTKDLSTIPAGSYVVTVTDARGCNLNEKFDVIRQLPITLSVNTVPDFNCQSGVLKEICTAQITGGIPPYHFTWSSGTTSGLSNEIMETSQPGIISLGVTDGQGCTANYTFNLTVPVAGIDYQLQDCNAHVFGFKAIIPIGIASDYSFSWDFGDGKTDTAQNPQHTYSAAGTYRVSLTLKAPSCTSVFEKDITIDPSPLLVLDKLPVFCIGDSILVHVSGADSYRWDNGSTGDNLLIKQTGTYTVYGTSKGGCTAALSFKATNFDSYGYTVQTDKNGVTTADPTLQLWSESITYSEYFWDFGDGKTAEGINQTHTYDLLKDGYYDVKLKVINPNGCNEFATKRIWITDASMGNVFTPNGDGIDDIFMKGYHIQIFNRNGIMLYDGTTGWDGTYKGTKVSNDTYFYVLYLSGTSGIKTKSGFITVIR